MPTECERSLTSLQQTQQQPQQQHQQQQQQQQQYQQDQELKREQAQGEEEEEDEENDYEQTQDTMNDSIMEDCSKNDAINGEMSTSQTSTTSSNGINGSSTNGRKTSLTSPDPTAYVAKARVTRPTPPPPSYNPMQFVQIKPCNLYQTAQEQLKKAEEVKKIKEIKKEEPEDWQNNLDNWKSSRRKRVEHIIDRVVEVKKLELEEHDRSRRKSKTFSEMIEERGDRPPRGRAKLAPLAVYNEDESNDLSDLGIGTSSASGKSSISEDYDNNSVLSDNAELDKAIIEQNQSNKQNSTTREYISSPGYDTSSSTAPASSPDPCEYTYEGAIQDYKQRVSRATSVGSSSSNYKIPTSTSTVSTDSSPTTTSIVPSKVLAVENGTTANVNMPTTTYPTRRGSKIEDRLIGFEVTSPSDQNQEVIEKQKVDVPKVDISKRKEIFENQQANEPKPIMTTAATSNSGGVPKVVLRDRFKFEANGGASAVNNHNNVAPAKQEVKRLSGDVTTIRERLQNLEQQKNSVNQTSQATKSNDTTMKATTASKLVDVPVPPLKARLTSLQNAVTKEEYNRIKPPVALVDARQLEIMQHEDETAKQRLKLLQEQKDDTHKPLPVVEEQALNQTALMTSDRDDSGIHNRSAGDEDVAVVECIVEQFQSEQEQQLEAAIAALALEEKQLEEAANAVNQIEAEFAELTDLNPAPLPNTATVTSDAAATTTTTATTKITNQQPSPAPPLRDMEFSINEALELALEEIDKESSNVYNKNAINQKQQQTTNKTDEEKNEIQIQIESQDNNDATFNENEFNDEAIISKEPIYENIISTVSMQEVDTEALIIPNKNQNSYSNNNSNKNNNMHNQIISQTNNNNNNNINNNNNNNFNDKTMKTNVLNNQTQQELQPNETTTTATTQKAKKSKIAKAATPTASTTTTNNDEIEPYYQVPKSSEPYYDAPKHLRPIPVYENIEIFYNGLEHHVTPNSGAGINAAMKMEPPKEKPPPPPIESPPPFDVDVDSSVGNTDTWSSDNTYETIATRRHTTATTTMTSSILAAEHPSPPIKRMNSTKRIKKELRNKRSSFLGIEDSMDDDESYLELTVAPPPDMAQLLQEERRLEKQLYIKAGLCDSSDTGESRDSGVSENHSRQSSEHYTNSSEENDHQLDTPPHSLQQQQQQQTNEIIYQNEAGMLTAAQTPLLQTVKGNSAESWTESATAAAAATQSLTEATATANAKMLSIEEKIREQEEVLRVERELLHFSQEELKRQRENLLLRENMARRELQHGAKMLLSATNRRSLQDLNGLGGVNGSGASGRSMVVHNGGMLSAFQPKTVQQQQQLPLLHQQQQQQQQQIYANIPNLQQQYYQVETDYRKSMSDLNEFSKRLMLPPTPPTKPLRAMHIATNGPHVDEYLTTATSTVSGARQRHSLTAAQTVYGGSLVKIANASMQVTSPTAAPRNGGHIYNNYHQHSHTHQHQHHHQHHQSAQNLSQLNHATAAKNGGGGGVAIHHGNMTRNTLHALSATPKPKYTDGWVQVQNRKSFDTNLANDPAWLSAYQQKRKSMPDTIAAGYHHQQQQQQQYNNHWLVQEAEQRRVVEQQQRCSVSNGNTPVHQSQQQQHSGNAAKANDNGKPLPDAIIQTLTERVQSKGIGERKRFDNYNQQQQHSQLNMATNIYQQKPQQQQNKQSSNNSTTTHRHHNELVKSSPQISNNNNNINTANNNNHNINATHDKVLSVSGKKKCSHCGDELGRGAAMIIESLLLFYHINCFKCCVCHVQLGDGLNGTDVRVRNHKLHCQNCYSSDDGIKFSCV